MSMLRRFSALILFICGVCHQKIPAIVLAPAIARLWCEWVKGHFRPAGMPKKFLCAVSALVPAQPADASDRPHFPTDM
jgi:hypothetical protein